MDHSSASQHGCFIIHFFLCVRGGFNLNQLGPVDKMTNQIHRAHLQLKDMNERNKDNVMKANRMLILV